MRQGMQAQHPTRPCPRLGQGHDRHTQQRIRKLTLTMGQTLIPSTIVHTCSAGPLLESSLLSAQGLLHQISLLHFCQPMEQLQSAGLRTSD